MKAAAGVSGRRRNPAAVADPAPGAGRRSRLPRGQIRKVRPDQEAVEDTAPGSWPTAAGVDQAAQTAGGSTARDPTLKRWPVAEGVSERLRPSRESLCRCGSLAGDPAGSWKSSGQIRKVRPLRGSLSCRRSTLPGRWPAAEGGAQYEKSAMQAISAGYKKGHAQYER